MTLHSLPPSAAGIGEEIPREWVGSRSSHTTVHAAESHETDVMPHIRPALVRSGIAVSDRRRASGRSALDAHASERTALVTVAAIRDFGARLEATTRVDRDDADAIDANTAGAAVLIDRAALTAVTAGRDLTAQHAQTAHRAAAAICIARARVPDDVIVERWRRGDAAPNVRHDATAITFTRAALCFVAAQVTRPR